MGLGCILDRDKDDAVLQLRHQLGSKDLLEVAAKRRNRNNDARVRRFADAGDEVAKELRRALNGVAQLGRLAAPRVRPELGQNREEDEVG